MFFSKIEDLFEKHNCLVYGERGDGKDVLMGNVIARRKGPYVANMDYTKDGRFIKVDFDALDCGRNTYKNLIDGDINFYEYPYPLGADIYISDLGCYFPCQYNSELNRRYPFLPTFFALSRHLGECNFHGNSQDLGRPWDKIREQSKTYIRCRGVNKFLMRFGIVFQKVTLYSKYESAKDCVEPCRIHVPLFAKRDVKLNAQMHVDKFFNTYGSIKTHYLLYLNKSKHDTHYFRQLFLEGKK